jgi:hypothetical protein
MFTHPGGFLLRGEEPPSSDWQISQTRGPKLVQAALKFYF